MVGSRNDKRIDGLNFGIDSLYVSATHFVLKGFVKDVSTIEIRAPWYIVAQLYSDSTWEYNLGGNFTVMNQPLAPDEKAHFSISYNPAGECVGVSQGA
ncbi:MAG: hypothetical protein GF398_15885 [Chitinivibrionales bacterium]|nr:hypothetical protein [Chitinivibrionales bacterium]